ncbi:MAG: sigma-70 family RNA polymerase sigma factor [Ruminococcaceae bacterium]|nr:sigma-70 family RNA polymerase sigma factor [Oscillospiraceae bacterium]
MNKYPAGVFVEVKDVNNPQLINGAKDGDTECLEIIFEAFRGYIRSIANKYYLVGADNDDLIQEGMIGLFKAIRDYRFGEGVTFHSFAVVCIQRQVKTALKLATRKKHLPLNQAVSLQSAKYEENGEKEVSEYIEDKKEINPEEIYINNETFAQLNRLLYEALSKLELNILILYNQHLSYKEISELTGKSVKSIDNAVQRIKKKLEVIKKQYMSM